MGGSISNTLIKSKQKKESWLGHDGPFFGAVFGHGLVIWSNLYWIWTWGCVKGLGVSPHWLAPFIKKNI